MTLKEAWQKRIDTIIKSDKLWKEANKLQMKVDKLRAESDKLRIDVEKVFIEDCAKIVDD